MSDDCVDIELDKKNHRLPLLEPEALNPDQHELYERMATGMLPWARQSGFKAEAEGGGLLGPFNAMLYSPELGAAQLNYLNTERDATALDARVREVVILTVGAVFASEYELYAHRIVAAKAGLAAEDIEAVATATPLSKSTQLSKGEVAAYLFVLALAKDHRVPPETFNTAQEIFGHKGLIDMIHLAGLYMTVSSLLNAFEVPVPA